VVENPIRSVSAVIKLASGWWSFRSASTASSVPSVSAEPRSAPKRSCNPWAFASVRKFSRPRDGRRFRGRVRIARTRWRAAAEWLRESSGTRQSGQSTVAWRGIGLRICERISRMLCPTAGEGRQPENRADHLNEAIRLPSILLLPFFFSGLATVAASFSQTRVSRTRKAAFSIRKVPPESTVVRLLLREPSGFGNAHLVGTALRKGDEEWAKNWKNSSNSEASS